MRRILATLGVLVLFAAALSLAGAATTPPGAPTAGSAVADRGASLASNDEAACGVETEQAGNPSSIVAAVGPHCCGAGAGAACRDQCKLQGPGCKGTIGCRAGECVCTCTCP